jgi:dihydropteroate synthase
MGVSIVRVHDVAEMVDVVKITNAISGQTNENYG